MFNIRPKFLIFFGIFCFISGAFLDNKILLYKSLLFRKFQVFIHNHKIDNEYKSLINDELGKFIFTSKAYNLKKYYPKIINVKDLKKYNERIFISNNSLNNLL